MLNMLRRKKTMKRILWALAIIIIPAFVLWGAGSMSERRSSHKYVGTIEGRKIPFDDLVKSIQDTQVSLFLIYFNQPEVLRNLRNNRSLLYRVSWENLIMSEKAKKAKISVSDSEVVDFITAFPLFSRGGAFDEKVYKYILRSSLGLGPRAFEESIRVSLVSEKYKEGIVKDITISEEEAREDYKERFEKAKLNYVVIDKAVFKEEAEASEEEIAAYYEENKDSFMEPEKIVLQYIAFPHTEEGAKEKALKDLASSYEAMKKRPSEMEDIARDLSLTLKKTRPFPRHGIVFEMADIKGATDIAFGLRPRVDILPLLDENETGTSYIIRVDEKIPERIKARSEIEPLILDAIKDKKALEVAKEKAKNIYETGVDRSLSLKNRLKKQKGSEKGLEIMQTEFISRHDYIDGVGESYELVEMAFKLAINEVSSPVEIRKGFALIEPVEFQPIDEEEFQKEKENHKARALSVKKTEALREWFNKAKSGTTLTADFDKL